jgi:hypothetical protein
VRTIFVALVPVAVKPMIGSLKYRAPPPIEKPFSFS